VGKRLLQSEVERGQRRSCKREERGEVYCIATYQRRKDGDNEEAEENPGDEEADEADSMAVCSTVGKGN
jgi:hypothetical protein